MGWIGQIPARPEPGTEVAQRGQTPPSAGDQTLSALIMVLKGRSIAAQSVVRYSAACTRLSAVGEMFFIVPP
jgi:hypothetical protein